MEAHERQRAAAAEAYQWETQAAARQRELLELEEGYLRMSDASLRLMKE